jgi:ATP-dependent DNA helicase RecQ
MKDALEILKQYWGYDSFRPGQTEIIEAVMEGNDVLALLPTGGGKSICFQVPALATDGLCLVITPLIALMKDQVENLLQRGINADFIHSGLTSYEVEKVLQRAARGDIHFLYLSPERISTRMMDEYLLDLDVSLIAIDEAHCISQWGYDFRPAYLKIAELREELPDVPVIALSASATLEVQHDICEKLAFRKNQKRFQQSFHRPNIKYIVEQPASKSARLIQWLEKSKNSTAIVYAKTRKETMQTAELLKQHGFSADHYHAGLSSDERAEKQQHWIENRTRIMVCTNAFGMGIDKPDVRMVIHAGMPESLENYYQEAGRAGRDGKESNAILLIAPHEEENLYKLNALRYPEPEELKKVYLNLMDHLQIAAGSGEGQRHNFDIHSFSESFQWNSLQASYFIQALAQEGLIFLTEKDTRPSRVEFITDKETLRDYGEQNVDMDKIIKGLLRTYEGIFDYPTSIYETHIAKFLSTPIGKIRAQLVDLHRSRIIRYEIAPEKPQLLLLMNRMYRDDLRFNLAALKARKQRHLERIKSMIGFVNNHDECRSVMIGKYFNDLEIKSCGICDVCEKNRSESKIDLQVLKEKMVDYLKDWADFDNIVTHFGMQYESEIKMTCRFLIENGIIIEDEWGKLKVKKKGPR